MAVPSQVIFPQLPTPQRIIAPPLLPNRTPMAVPQQVIFLQVPTPQRIVAPPQLPNRTPTAVPQQVIFPQVPAPQRITAPPQLSNRTPMLASQSSLTPRPMPLKPGGPARRHPVAVTEHAHRGGLGGGQSGGQGTMGEKIPKIIPSRPGRQPLHSTELHAHPDVQTSVQCLTAGHGARRTMAGATLRHAGDIDSYARDVPARHPERSDCLIHIRRALPVRR